MTIAVAQRMVRRRAIARQPNDREVDHGEKVESEESEEGQESQEGRPGEAPGKSGGEEAQRKKGCEEGGEEDREGEGSGEEAGSRKACCGCSKACCGCSEARCGCSEARAAGSEAWRTAAAKARRAGRRRAASEHAVAGADGAASASARRAIGCAAYPDAYARAVAHVADSLLAARQLSPAGKRRRPRRWRPQRIVKVGDLAGQAVPAVGGRPARLIILAIGANCAQAASGRPDRPGMLTPCPMLTTPLLLAVGSANIIAAREVSPGCNTHVPSTETGSPRLCRR